MSSITSSLKWTEPNLQLRLVRFPISNLQVVKKNATVRQFSQSEMLSVYQYLAKRCSRETTKTDNSRSRQQDFVWSDVFLFAASSVTWVGCVNITAEDRNGKNQPDTISQKRKHRQCTFRTHHKWNKLQEIFVNCWVHLTQSLRDSQSWICEMSRVLFFGCCFISSFHWNELMQSRGVRRPSVCPSVCKLLHASRFFYHKHDWIATKLVHDSPHKGLHPACAQGQGQGQRSRDTGTSVMSRTVCHTVPSDVLSLHAFTLRSTVTLSFHYRPKCQAARCNVYIMEWATPSLTVWF